MADTESFCSSVDLDIRVGQPYSAVYTCGSEPVSRSLLRVPDSAQVLVGIHQGQGQCNGNDLEDWHYQAGRHLAVMFAFCMERRVFLGYHFTPADGRKDVLAVVYRFRDQMPRVIV